MNDNPDLASLLSTYMGRAGFKDARLANLVNQVTERPHFIHRSTIRNWRTGDSKAAEDWRQLAAVAHVLRLNEVETNQLLHAAGHASVREFWLSAGEADREFLLYWTERAPLQGIDENLSRIQAGVVEILNQRQTPVTFSVPTPTQKLSVETWQYQANGGVTSVAVSADGKTVIAGTLDKNVLGLDDSGSWHWKTSLGNQVWRIELSAAGDVVVAGTGSTRFWDMKGRGLYCLSRDGHIRWQADFASSVWGLSCSVDGSTIAVGTSEKQLLVFDKTGQRLWQYDVQGIGWYAWVWCTALSADGQIVISGSADKHIRLFDRPGNILGEHQTRGDVFTVSISADGSVAAAADNQGHIYFLHQHNWLSWKERVDNGIWQVQLSHNGQYLLVGAGKEEPHLRLYDQGGRLLWKRFVGGNVSCLDMDPRGEYIVVGTYQRDIFIFDGAGNVLTRVRAKKVVRDVAIAATRTIAVAGSEDGVVYGFRLMDAIGQDDISN